MNKRIVERLVLVLLRGKASEAILKHEDPKRKHVGNKNVDPEVKLVLIDEVGRLQVLLNDHVLAHVGKGVGVKSLGDVDAFALRQGFRFDDETGVGVGD